jgi:hypothetical protein
LLLSKKTAGTIVKKAMVQKFCLATDGTVTASSTSINSAKKKLQITRWPCSMRHNTGQRFSCL